MQIEKITFRNFGSYGNRTLTLNIPLNPSFFLISGRNGHGKSTLLEVIKFAIYGRLESKRLKDIANILNKNAYVRIEMKTIKGKVIIERGIEPGFFELWVNPQSKNDPPIDKAGKKSVQEYLEEEILEMPFYVFVNTLSLSINDFKSFVKMTNADKKAIIDKLFGFQIINEMRDILKQNMKIIRNNINDINLSINAFIETLNTSERELEILAERIKEDNINEKQKIEIEINTYKNNLDLLKQDANKINEKYEHIQKTEDIINKHIVKDRQIINSLKEKIQLYENSKCPLCESDLDTEFHTETLKNYKTLLDETNKSLKKYQEKLNEIDISKTKFNNVKSDNTFKINDIKTRQNIAIGNLRKISSGEVDDKQLQSLQTIIDNSNENISTHKDKQHKYNNTLAFYNIVEEFLGDRGIKNLAIRTILPMLNSEILKNVKVLGIQHKIIFNEEFDAVITHYGKECSPNTLSTGETKKIDFAVLLAVIKIMKMKFPTLNVLFLDEIFSSIDQLGQIEILNLLNDIVKEYKLNIFVINHYPLSSTHFDYNILVSKNAGFSSFQIEKCR